MKWIRKFYKNTKVVSKRKRKKRVSAYLLIYLLFIFISGFQLCNENIFFSPPFLIADLKGLKVAHGLEDFTEGSEQILVLEDKTIEQNEGI